MSRRLAVESWREALRTSLLAVPILFVVVGLVAAWLLLRLDDALLDRDVALPGVLRSSVDGARAILTTVATATMTVAGIAFSVALLVFQLASTRYSPRVIDNLFRDPFNTRVIGVVVGTFSYCLVVLTAVRGPGGQDGETVVPAVSVAVAVLLGLVTVLAVVAFIDHSAHSMDVSELLRRATDAAVAEACRRASPGNASDGARAVVVGGLDDLGGPDHLDDAAGFVVTADRHGWFQRIDRAGLLAAVPAGSTVRLDVAPGTFSVPGAPLCTVRPPPAAADREDVTAAVRRAVRSGRTRTVEQDLAYGIRQITDVAVIALSPGVNDPTTARDAISHLLPVLRAALTGPGPRPWRDRRGSVLVPAADPGHRDLVTMAFDEIRRDAASRPAVCAYLVDALHLLLVGLPDTPDTADARRELRRQARLTVAGCAAAGPMPEDLADLEDRYERRFGAGRDERVPAFP